MGEPKVSVDDTLASYVASQEDWEMVGTFTDQMSVQTSMRRMRFAQRPDWWR
jgi:hypothetical protein